MHIDRLELFHVAMPLLYPWKTAYGEDAAIHSVLCRIDSGSVSAWGESTPLAAPCYSPEWAGGIFHTALHWLGPALLDNDILSGSALQEKLSHIKGNPFAKALFDNAWWALQSVITSTPLHELLGGSRRQVSVGADFGIMDSLDDLLACIQTAVDDKFPRIKLKYRPGWDLNMLRAVRSAFPTQVFHIDCNSGYRLSDIDHLKQLDSFELAMIEQPLNHDDLLDHATLQSQLDTPICLDESISSVQMARQAIQLKSCKYINIKPGRVGGLTNAVMIHDHCKLAGVPCWVGGMLESSIGGAACTALATLDNFTYPADIFPTTRYYHQDLSDPPISLQSNDNGVPCIAVPQQLPVPNERMLRECLVQSAVVTK
ncbi:MAG: o-succinylbenzoate synthase [Planctomycetota bacterium]|nr:o-succinylbenzoate synthase [Planctomycetota bacterium]